MELDLTIPAVLFSVTSLILLAYTNRFLALASIIRGLRDQYNPESDHKQVLGQLKNLNKRIYLIKYMQLSGVLSLFTSVGSMLLLFEEYTRAGGITFAISLLLMLLSLGLSAWEINISAKALELYLSDIEAFGHKKKF